MAATLTYRLTSLCGRKEEPGWDPSWESELEYLQRTTYMCCNECMSIYLCRTAWGWEP